MTWTKKQVDRAMKSFTAGVTKIMNERNVTQNEAVAIYREQLQKKQKEESKQV